MSDSAPKKKRVKRSADSKKASEVADSTTDADPTTAPAARAAAAEQAEPADAADQAEPIVVEPRPSLAFKTDGAITEHRLSLDELAGMFAKSHIDVNDAWLSRGLSTADADEMLTQHGRNELTPPKEMGELERFARQFANLLMILLMIAGFLSLAAYIYNPADQTNLYLTIILLFAVVLTCTISYLEGEVFFRKTKSLLCECLFVCLRAEASVLCSF